MPDPNTFQWHSELGSPPPSVVQGAFEDDDDFIVAQTLDDLRCKKTGIKDLQLPPFPSLSIRHICTVRDQLYGSGKYGMGGKGSSEGKVISSCVRLLNQSTATVQSEEKGDTKTREMALLSLISPRGVVFAVCNWALRQTIPTRVLTSCRLLSELGALASYRCSKTEASLLCNWFEVNLKESTLPESKDKLTRLYKLLLQFLQTSNDLGLLLLRPLECLNLVAQTLFKKEHTMVAVEVTSVVSESMEKTSFVFLDEEIPDLASTFQGLLRCCSFENRLKGSNVLQEATKALDALTLRLSRSQAEKLAARLTEGTSWPAVQRMKVLHAEGEVNLRENGLFVAGIIKRHIAGGVGPLLKQCEIVIISVATTCKSWEHRTQLFEACQGLACTDQNANQDMFRNTWLAAMTRQMRYLSTDELVSLFRNGLPGFLPPHGQECKLGSQKSCVDCVKWCSIANCTQFGLHAITILFRSNDFRTRLLYDDISFCSVVKAICFAMVQFTELQGEAVAPTFILCCLLRDLYSMVVTSCGDDNKCIRDQSEIRDVLTSTVLELWIKISARTTQEGSPDARYDFSSICSSFQENADCNAICHRIHELLMWEHAKRQNLELNSK